MGIFKAEKRDLAGNLVESYTMKNVILDTGMNYLCGDAADFNASPAIGVGSSDITPDTNQADLLLPVMIKPSTYTPGVSSIADPEGEKTFSVAVTFAANEAIGDLAELVYYMADTPTSALNRTLFQVPGTLDTELIATPELDQLQNADISNLFQVYGVNTLDQSFTAGASGGTTNTVTNLAEVELSLASSGVPTFPVSVQIYDDNEGQPGNLLGETTLSTFAEPVQRWRSVYFSPSIAVTVGNVYHIVVSCAGTNLENCYDVFGSFAQQYFFGTLSTPVSGGGYAPTDPIQDLGFKTYYNISDGINHDYVLTSIQFENETTQSADFPIAAFPENNLDLTNTNQGTVRLTVPTYANLPEFTSAIKIYKKVTTGSVISYDLLGTVGTIRNYFYDNGTIIPDSTKNPPSTDSVVSTPTGLTSVLDTVNGGPLQLGQDRFYQVSAILQGPLNQSLTQLAAETIAIGSYVYTGVYTGNPSVPPWYSKPYQQVPVPLIGLEYETAVSAEYALTAPTEAFGPFVENFLSNTLDPTLWNITNINDDYYNVQSNGTHGTQLQMSIPGSVASATYTSNDSGNYVTYGALPNSVPWVISSTRQVRAGQSYYVTMQIPLAKTAPPTWVYPGGMQVLNPIYSNHAPNRCPLFSFVNPSAITSQNTDKRLSFEYGYYNLFRLDNNPDGNWVHDDWGDGNTNDYATTGAAYNSMTPYWALYDNVGNAYLWSKATLKPSHADGSYSFKIDIGLDLTMTVSLYDTTTNAFQPLPAGLGAYSPHTQYNGSHYHNYQQDNMVGGLPGPLTQITNHFLVPETYSFAIGNPSNDPLCYSDVNYNAESDNLYPIPGLTNTPGIAMTVNNSSLTTASGYNAAITWNSVPGARKYRLYSTTTSGQYDANSLVMDYETYFPAYAVQTTDTLNNDWQNNLIAVGPALRNWQDIGVTFGVDTSNGKNYGEFNGYALGGFIGPTNYKYGNPPGPNTPNGPTIVSTPGTAEGYLLVLNNANNSTANPGAGTSELAMFTFMGGGCEIVAEISPKRGIGAIYIDGNFSGNVDFYNDELLEQQSVWSTTMPVGYHTITVHATPTNNDYSVGYSIGLDYFHITVPGIVDNTQQLAGTPSPTDDPNIGPVAPPPVKSSRTYNGNGPCIVIKDAAHTLSVEMQFGLLNPNLS